MGSRRTTVVLLVAGLATAGVYVAGFAFDTTRDRPDTLDVQPTKDVATQACTRMRLELDALPPLPAGASQQERRDRLAVQDRAVRELVDSVRALGEPVLRKDVPADAWLADWTLLADARTAYAAAGAQGPFVLPSPDGHPVTQRMNAIGVAPCVVPVPLTRAP